MLRLPDGRDLEILELGVPDGLPLLYHGGQPSAAWASPMLDEVARDAGMRLVTCSRPGYGASSPRPLPDDGPRVADDVADCAALLDHLGISEFVTLGWSGGGPRALACAALLPDRCRAATSLAGAAPYDAEGLDWPAGMGQDNIEEYAAAVAGPEPYGELLTEAFLPVLGASQAEVARSMSSLFPPVDVEALDGGMGELLFHTFRRAGEQGVRGVRDDGLAVVQPWGFDVGSIRVPVAIWQGSEDAMVPFAHGRWLAAHVPGARAHLETGEGHVSLVRQLPAMLAELREMAGL